MSCIASSSRSALAAARREFSSSAICESKLKTHQGAAKRWKAVGNGSFKRAQAGKQHLNSGFAPARINALSQTVYSNHTQTKTLRRLIPYAARRSLSTDTRAGASASAVVAPVPDRAVLELTGPDAAKFLKGLTSRDVEAAGPDAGGGYSGFLNATGRVLHDVFIYPTTITRPGSATSVSGISAGYLIDYPTAPAHPFPLPAHLRRFVLRSRVRMRDATDEYAVHAAWGGEADDAHGTAVWKAGNGGSAEPSWTVGVPVGERLGEGEVGCWDLRGGSGREGMGRRVLVRRDGRASALADHETGSEADYILRRMLLGVPEGAGEIIPGVALPLESCMDLMGGIDFRKGCYVGQELTVRTYHTGHTRKRIMPLRFLPGSVSSSVIPPHAPASWSSLGITPPPPGSPISYIPPPDAASQRPKAAVKVLSVHPVHAIGLGLMRLELVERRWGSTAWGQAVPEQLVGTSDRGELVAEGGLRVWAGKGRGWYADSEQELQGPSESES